MIHKRTKIILIVLLIMGLSSASLFGCRLLTMIGKDNKVLSSQNTGDLLENALDELQSQSTTTYNPYFPNDDGWALLYYLPDDPGTVFIERGDGAAYNSSAYDDFQSEIVEAEAHIVIGHIRAASSGATGIDDPHPFLWETDEIIYSFAHNGTLSGSDITYISNHLESPYDENYTTDPIVDSELYFRWIIQNIAQNGWNVNEGIHAALEELIGSWNMNFVFSDGTDIYNYRNSIDNDHELQYSPSSSNESSCFRLIMSDFGDLNLPGQGDINDDELLFHPFTGRTTLFKEYSNDKPYYNRTLHPNWNWESFPVVPDVSGDYNAELMVDPLLPYIEKVVASDNREMTYYGGTGWYHDPLDFTMVNWNELYKLRMNNWIPWSFSNNLSLAGYLRPDNEPTLENAISRHTYWVSYTLLPTQNIVDAFGSVWDKVESVKAEDWYYCKQTIPRNGNSIPVASNSTKGKYLEFGKGYIISFNEDVAGFVWHYPHTPIWGSARKGKPQSFTYNEKSDYNVIDVIDIPANVTEIGIFEDDECVGASVVDSSKAQILAYTSSSGRDPVALTFQLEIGRGGKSTVNNYSVFDQKKSKFEIRKLYSHSDDYSIVKLSEIELPASNFDKERLQVLANYPNPYNMNIGNSKLSFYVPCQTTVSVNIYNIWGQKVKDLYNGEMDSGKYDAIWDGTGYNGESVVNGVYFYQVKTSNQNAVSKILLIR
ncbi:MAG: class II glutamine amidotransferase [Candidatus Cloacimonadota bacterium]|nr:class II glutamine amidotransferase [Candidatus Cloacimonadota bacterium]